MNGAHTCTHTKREGKDGRSMRPMTVPFPTEKNWRQQSICNNTIASANMRQPANMTVVVG